jgi:hypothetical protein
MPVWLLLQKPAEETQLAYLVQESRGGWAKSPRGSKIFHCGHGGKQQRLTLGWRVKREELHLQMHLQPVVCLALCRC